MFFHIFSPSKTFSSPASLAANRVWFHFNPRGQTMTVEGRGVNASVVEKDIGTVNGVIQVEGGGREGG